MYFAVRQDKKKKRERERILISVTVPAYSKAENKIFFFLFAQIRRSGLQNKLDT
jgi:hypothetical protein